MSTPEKYLRPDVIRQVSRLDLRAKGVNDRKPMPGRSQRSFRVDLQLLLKPNKFRQKIRLICRGRQLMGRFTDCYTLFLSRRLVFMIKINLNGSADSR